MTDLALGIIIAVAVIIIFIIVPGIVGLIIKKRFIRRYDMEKYSLALRPSDMQGKYEPRHVSFNSGNNILHGYIFGEKNEGGLIIFCHGLFGGAAEYFSFAKHFVDAGKAVFMFDNTGCNMSEGKDIKSSMQGLYDLDAAYNYLLENESELMKKSVALIGHSWGGFAVAAYPVADKNIICVVSLAGYNKASVAIFNCLRSQYKIIPYLIYPYIIVFHWLKHRRQGYITSVENINKSNIPYLIIQGTNDVIISHDYAAIYDYRKSITNENVRYILRTDEKHNRHNTIYRDAEATKLMSATYKELKIISEECLGSLRDINSKKLCTPQTRFAVNKLDDEIMREIDKFLEENSI